MQIFENEPVMLPYLHKITTCSQAKSPVVTTGKRVSSLTSVTQCPHLSHSTPLLTCYPCLGRQCQRFVARHPSVCSWVRGWVVRTCCGMRLSLSPPPLSRPILTAGRAPVGNTATTRDLSTGHAPVGNTTTTSYKHFKPLPKLEKSSKNVQLFRIHKFEAWFCF